MARVAGAEAVYLAAVAFRERGLRTSRSVFTRSKRLWTREALDDLAVRLEAAGDTFAERWETALAGALPAAVRLAAEVCYVHALFPSDLSPATKRGLVQGTLSRSATTPRVPADLDAALDVGVAGTGVAFKARRMSQLRLLVTCARACRRLPRGERDAVLDDPFSFKAWLFGCEHDGAHAQREALLHLLFPDTFEPIVSPRVKRRVVEAFAGCVPDGTDDVDEALLAIRRELAREHPAGFTFADPSLRQRWQPGGIASA